MNHQCQFAELAVQVAIITRMTRTLGFTEAPPGRNLKLTKSSDSTTRRAAAAGGRCQLEGHGLVRGLQVVTITSDSEKKAASRPRHACDFPTESHTC